MTAVLPARRLVVLVLLSFMLGTLNDGATIHFRPAIPGVLELMETHKTSQLTSCYILLICRRYIESPNSTSPFKLKQRMR